MGDFSSTQDMIIYYLIIGIFVFLLFLAVKSIFTPVKTVKAIVIDKHKFETPSKFLTREKRQAILLFFQ